MNKIRLVVIALFIALMSLMGTSAPAAHAAWGTDVTHASDDSGYNADIHVVCTDGRSVYLGLGQRTAFTSGGADGCGWGGVQRIVVGYNQTVYCKNYLPPYQNIYYYTGRYNEVPSAASLKCYMQRPL